MSQKTLMIVESPAKARTISKLLGSDTEVLASMGHVSDLPPRDLGVDVNNGFKPHYELTSNGRKVIHGLKSAAKKADLIILATDPDREGEAIAWHLRNLLQGSTKGVFQRVAYHEITRAAITEALKHPGDIKLPLVDAQQARRVLDRLVGYQVSPLLWRNVEKDTSAGRVQSVALRLIVEREREIQAFKPVEYWNLDAEFSPEATPQVRLKTRLTKLNGVKAEVPDAATANALAQALEDATTVHKLARVTDTPRTQHAPPPFITSTLQQAAGSSLRYGTNQTMKLAQELYEGVETAGGTTGGLITYMRTDSVNIAAEAQRAALDYIRRTYGPAYVPPTPNRYRSGKSAQEAHEAIRPTDVNRTPDSLANVLSPMQLKLYRLIWNRFVASQMAASRQIDHAIEVESTGPALDSCGMAAGKPLCCLFRTAARETVFDGYAKVYSFKDLDSENDDEQAVGPLPELFGKTLAALIVAGKETCHLCQLQKEQCFTQPPSRFSEASLVKALESNGIGRPSTFASIVKTILDRKYVEKQKLTLQPTPLGFKVNDYLVGSFPQLFEVGFTAQMENELDQIESGELDWEKMLKQFYGEFKEWMASRGSVLPVPDTIGQEKAARLLQFLCKGDFPFDAPRHGARRVYDDGKLAVSLKAQLTAKPPKPLSARQQAAVLSLVAKYITKDEGLAALTRQLGLADEVANRSAALDASREKELATPSENALTPALLEMLDAMKKVKWEEPVKRGRRIYDDGKFFRSIVKQAEVSQALSAAQVAAVLKLAAKYAAVIPSYDTLAQAVGVKPTALEEGDDETADGAQGNGAPHEECVRLLEAAAGIKGWQPAAKRGRRTYDDKEFVESLQEQFQRRGVLSERQVAALARVVAKYTDEPTTGADNNPAISPSTTRRTSEPTGENCPECGAPLVRRMSRRGPFIGCSAYPKCRYSRDI